MVFYITFSDFNSPHHGVGVKKKVRNQVEAMERRVGKVYYTYYSSPRAYLIQSDGEIVESDIAPAKKNYIEILMEWLQKYDVKRTYIRYPRANKWFIDLLKFQKQKGIKTVLEIPTYPYPKVDEIYNLEDLIYREQINKYVDRITTYSADKEIWGVPCFNLLNGIALEDVSKNSKAPEKNRINFIAVSSMRHYHGYERFLEGLHLYYQCGGNYNLKCRMVGSGPEEQRYKDLVKKYHLESYVEFIGRIESWENEKLDYLYSLSDIAIGSLALYKEGITRTSPIKGSEYCAKGIPFICAYQDLGFPENCEFIINIPNTPDPVDMNKVIEFYEDLISRNDYRQVMYDYAVNYLTWDAVMRPVMEYLME